MDLNLFNCFFGSKRKQYAKYLKTFFLFVLIVKPNWFLEQLSRHMVAFSGGQKQRANLSTEVILES